MYHRFVLSLLIFLTVFMTGCSSPQNKADNSITDLCSEPNFIKTRNEIDSIISQINKKHSVRVCYKNRPMFRWGRYKYTLAPKSDYGKVLKYLKMLQHELNKYPKTFLQGAGVKRIVVCKGLSSLGYSAYGFPNPGGKAVYYDYTALDCGGLVYSKNAIHHELNHMVEAKFNSNIYYKDTDWAKLNSKDFKYGKGGRHFKRNESNSKKPFHPRAGFITSYATSALQEDKAEVYAALFVEEINAYLYDWIKEDEILRNKVKYMKDFLSHLCNEMNVGFWEGLYTGEYRPLGGRSDRTYETSDSGYLATISDNSVVELIAIGEYSNNGKWWRANGEILDELPFRINWDNTANAANEDGLRKFRILTYIKTKCSDGSSSTSWAFEGGTHYPKILRSYFDEDGRIIADMRDNTFAFPKDKQTTRLRLGVTDDEWTTRAVYSPKTGLTGSSNEEITFSKPRMEDGKLRIEVTPIFLDLTKMAEMIVAIDFAGEMHHPIFEKITVEDEGRRKASLCFQDLNLAQVKEFHFKTCSYTWVTFENISLRPGQITDVQIKVENN